MPQQITVPTAANDNDWDGRQVLAWPTATRLVRSARLDDLAMLKRYKDLLAIAYGYPANDNWTDAAPPPGEDDDRSAAECIEEVDRIMIESSLKPTIAEMQAASPPWPTDDQTPAPRARLVASDKGTGAGRWEFAGEQGGLAFINSSELREYRTKPTGKWRRPHVVLGHHRTEKKQPLPTVVPSSGHQWSLEAQIEARDELRIIHQSMPASTIMFLELACGSTKAQEVGEAYQKREKTAERLGVAIIDHAISNLRAAWNPSIAVAA